MSVKYITFSTCCADTYNYSSHSNSDDHTFKPGGTSPMAPLPLCLASLLQRQWHKQRKKRPVDLLGYFEIWVAYGASQESKMQILLTAVFTCPASSPYRWLTNAAAGLGRGRA